MRRHRWCNRTLIKGPYFCLVLTQEDFDKELKALGIPLGPRYVGEGSNATMREFTSDKGAHCCIVGLKPGSRDGIEVASTLIHEAVHIWQMHRNHIGEDSPGLEIEAYAIQSIAEELMRSYVQQTGSIQ